MASLGGGNLPYIITGEQIKIRVSLLNSAKVSDTYTGFTGETISATATIDDDFIWVVGGALLTDISGAITSIAITYTGDGFINSIGSVYLTNSGGLSETVNYTAYTETDNVYTFTVDVTLTNTYETDDSTGIQQVPIIRATSVDTTDKNNGVFDVILEANSAKYFSEIQGTSGLGTLRFELLVRDSNAVLIYVIAFGFLCFNVQDYTGAIPIPQSPLEYVTITNMEAYLSGKMNLLTSAVENYIPSFETEGQLQSTGFRIEGDKIIGSDGEGGYGYLQFKKVNGVMTIDINEEL
jgi:hypothetical protein